MGILTVAVVTVLWWAGTRGLDGKELVSARLESLKVGLSIGIGGGGMFALYLAWRRQRSTEADLDNRERTLEHQQLVASKTEAYQDRVAAAAETDSAARRVTELYAKAADLLGSNKAPVRLAGLYAFERLAQDNPDAPNLRQTVVNVLCAYLRMSYPMPSSLASESDDDATRNRVSELADESIHEREVRLTAQRILTGHLRHGEDDDNPSITFWEDVDIDLTGATLIDLDFTCCFARTAIFAKAIFVGTTRLDKAAFAKLAVFDRAKFDGPADFEEVEFEQGSSFKEVTFSDYTGFSRTKFKGNTSFYKAMFSGTSFNMTMFDGAAEFQESRFIGFTSFLGPLFSENADFHNVTFERSVNLMMTFRKLAGFQGATFNEGVQFSADFWGDARFDRSTFHGEVHLGGDFCGDASFTGATVHGSLLFHSFRPMKGMFHFQKLKVLGDVNFGETEFQGKVNFDNADFGGNVELNRATFSRGLTFSGARFRGEVHLDRSSFKGPLPTELGEYSDREVNNED
ncbi:pentapeptide repeat-containing protein [Amycolatopsis sp. DG1A-15b]|uniref:pentapeptide repeat-containing protein n=1 Tax=Amycolatopsis sp. DG1A-15b TaxID=3052846 RepID=UPI00255B8D2B|nr:pentapeptide repeat-containing protein [Amycolatopsis sp. DG1A-15b]WIX85690.1 pentapeptide repeat-containing protein [Amycolatopsis sp. DG1A-15b]